MLFRRFLGEKRQVAHGSYKIAENSRTTAETDGIDNMKLTQLFGAAIVAALSLATMTTARASSNGSDDAEGVSIPTVSYQEYKSLRRGKVEANVIYLTNLPAGLQILSVASSSSPNTAQVQTNVMKKLLGITVPMDPATDPAAVSEPTTLQWWHSVATPTFPSHMGQTTGLTGWQTNQHGQRLVASMVVFGSPRDHYVRVESSHSEYLPVGFYNVTTNTANPPQLLAFGRNYLGVSFGGDQCESFVDLAAGVIVMVGNDVLYRNGESPADVHVDMFIRFGGTSVFNAATPAEMQEVRTAFLASNQWFRATLYKKAANGDLQTVSTKTISSEPATIAITREGSGARLTVVNGMAGQEYFIESRPAIGGSGSWTPLSGHRYMSGGSTNISFTDPQRYYRLAPVTVVNP